MEFKKIAPRMCAFVLIAGVCAVVPSVLVSEKPPGTKDKTKTAAPATLEFKGIIGPDSKKIRVEGDKTFVWGGVNPKSGKEEWYDFTGAPFKAADLQYGIGKYRIVAINDPLFVDPKDERLKDVPVSPYRRDERPETPDEIMVIGWVEGDDVRAYPISLLDRHELVNDSIGGKPVTVGW